MKKKVTIVTGLWNLGRGGINEGFKRPYENYLQKFAELLRTDANMYIYVAPEDEEFIWQHRSRENTYVHLRSLEEFKTWFSFTERTNELRQCPEWTAQAEWLLDSPQATLEMYNPVVMGKMFLLNDASLFNPFNSEYFFWIDAGIASTVHPGYFYHDKVFDNLPNYCKHTSDFIFLAYPYVGGQEIHGFPRKEIAVYCDTEYVDYVCRGGFFGGKKHAVNNCSNQYYGYLKETLEKGLMGTEESIFTILAHKNNDIHKFEIEDNGLVWPFFEKLKEYHALFDKRELALYVITYNSPTQFDSLCKSIERYDKNILERTKKYLLNNSTDRNTDGAYAELCQHYDFEEIKKDNIGICGGRQFIAEHFDTTSHTHYLFFEDDMCFYLGEDSHCRCGFNRHVSNILSKVLGIIKEEDFDFLKLNFTEFFGDNGTQWAWYNVPPNVRQETWPEAPYLPQHGLAKNPPKTLFKHIKTYLDIAYATGEIYYCNWPQIVSREGNRKMFLDVKWEYPYEQTWMSYIFQETRKNNIKPGLLLLTPTEHNRFEHYSSEERKEN